MASVEQQIAELAQRVRYGFAVDSNDAEALTGLYTDDCVIEMNRWELEWRAAGRHISRRQSFGLGVAGAQAALNSGLRSGL